MKDTDQVHVLINPRVTSQLMFDFQFDKHKRDLGQCARKA